LKLSYCGVLASVVLGGRRTNQKCPVFLSCGCRVGNPASGGIKEIIMYPKIKTVFTRDPKTKYRTLVEGEFATLEFEYLQSNTWIWTEKVDGTNIRVMFDGNNITFGGKTDRAQIPAFLVNKLNELFLSQVEVFKRDFPDGVCLYGEGYGAKIQKGGGNYRPDQGFVLFDVKIGEWWLKREDVSDVATKLEIDTVPEVGIGNMHEMVEFVRHGFRSKWGDFQAEGIVARPLVELATRSGSRIITKIKRKDFNL